MVFGEKHYYQIGAQSLLKRAAQQNVHPTLGSRRVFRQVSGLRLVPAKWRFSARLPAGKPELTQFNDVNPTSSVHTLIARFELSLPAPIFKEIN